MVGIVYIGHHDLYRFIALHDPFDLGLCPPPAKVPAINKGKNKGRDKRR